jgi:hypothetical protein
MYSTLDAMHGFVIWNLAFLVLCFWLVIRFALCEYLKQGLALLID